MRRLRRTALAGVIAALVFHWVLPWCFPIPESLLTDPQPSLTLTDRHGTPLRQLLLDGRCRTRPVPLAELPPDLIACVLAAEDSRFYSHSGIDYLALARSVRDAARSGHFTSGASTITQQLVKITAGPAPRTVWTKLRDMLTARRLEMTWKKDRILEAWLNRVDFGQLCQGAAAASDHYFHKPLSDLSLAECAALAGLPQSPVRHSRGLRGGSASSRAGFQRRWQFVLNRLAAAKPDMSERVAAACAVPPLATEKRSAMAAGHITDLLRHSGRGRKELRTTIDLPLQEKCEEILRSELAQLAARHVQQGAAVVMDNATGEILAMAGSSDYSGPQGQINGALAIRSAGSALKPFTYALALERGWSPGSILADVPITYAGTDRVMTPVNFDRHHRGPVTLREALAGSLNVPAVALLKDIGGPQPLCDLLTSCGLTTLTEPPGHYGLGLTIGNAGVRLIDLVSAYAVLARGGGWLPARLTPPDSPAHNPDTFPVSRVTALLISGILSDNAARSGQFGVNSVLRLPFRCACKTGTSSDFRDNWCLGFTPEFTVGVWTGNFDGSPMNGVSGVAGAAPVFRRIMEHLHSRRPPHWPAEPDGLLHYTADARTGHVLTNAGVIPAVHRREEVCAVSHAPVPASPNDYDADGCAFLDDSVYGAWYRSTENNRRTAFALRAPAAETAPRILSPVPGTTYRLDPELPRSGGLLPLRSNLPHDSARWTCDTLTQGPAAGTLLLRPGQHTVRLTDSRTGATSETRLVVE